MKRLLTLSAVALFVTLFCGCAFHGKESNQRIAARPASSPGPAAIVVEKSGFSEGPPGYVGFGVVLRNTSSDHDATHVEVWVHLLGASGREIGWGGTVEHNPVPAGSELYVGGYIQSGTTKKPWSLQVAVGPNIRSVPAHYHAPSATGLRLGSSYWDDRPIVVGHLRNTSSRPWGAQIDCVYLDPRGNVVGGGYGFAPRNLEPGHSTSFTLRGGTGATPRSKIAVIKITVDPLPY